MGKFCNKYLASHSSIESSQMHSCSVFPYLECVRDIIAIYIALYNKAASLLSNALFMVSLPQKLLPCAFEETQIHILISNDIKICLLLSLGFTVQSGVLYKKSHLDNSDMHKTLHCNSKGSMEILPKPTSANQLSVSRYSCSFIPTALCVSPCRSCFAQKAFNLRIYLISSGRATFQVKYFLCVKLLF